MTSLFSVNSSDLQRSVAGSCLRWLSLAMLLVSLAACVASPEPAPAPAPVQVPAPAPVAASAPAPAPEPVPTPAPAPIVTGAEPLREGLAAYQAADYRRAETRLQDALRLGVPISDQLQAHKTMAFIYCVTRRAPLCEKSFETAFDTAKTAGSSFELSRAERGHPLWGPVYSRVLARQNSTSASPKPAAMSPKPAVPASAPTAKPPAKR